MLISLFNAVFRRGKSVLRRTWRPLGDGKRTVMEIAQSIDPTIEMPKALVDVAPVDTDARWNQDIAKKFAASNYRDTYLERFLPMYKIYNRIYK